MAAHEPMSVHGPEIDDPGNKAGNPFQSVLRAQEANKTWFMSLAESLRDLAEFKKQPPLQVSFRPITEAEMLASDDPKMRQMAALQQDVGFFQSLLANVKSLFATDTLPPSPGDLTTVDAGRTAGLELRRNAGALQALVHDIPGRFEGYILSD